MCRQLEKNTSGKVHINHALQVKGETGAGVGGCASGCRRVQLQLLSMSWAIIITLAGVTWLLESFMNRKVWNG